MRICHRHIAVVIALTVVLISSFLACRSKPDAVNNQTPGAADSAPPITESVGVSDISESSATITWQTDEESTGKVQYSKTPQNLDRDSQSDKLTTSHSITLKQLDMGTTYHYRIISKDANGNEAASEIDTFVTVRPVGCAIGNRAPDFTLKDIHGRDVRLSDSLGKVVVMNFWYAGCSPCEVELPYWQEAFHRWSSDNITLLTIHRNVISRDSMIQWVRNHHFMAPTLYDQKGEVAGKYCLVGVPETFFIATDGSIQYIQMGFFTSCQEIENKLNSVFGTLSTTRLQMYYTDPNTGKPASHWLETCTLEFNLAGPEFNYVLDAHYLKPKTEYSLIYFSDPWPTNHAATLIGSAMADPLGNIKLADSIDLGMSLPDAEDPNHPVGAKILLVLSSDYDLNSKVIKQWHPDKYLWPGFLITYTDTDIP